MSSYVFTISINCLSRRSVLFDNRHILRVQILKLLIMPFSPTCCLAPNISLSTMFSDATYIFFPHCESPGFQSCSKNQVQKIASFTTSRNFPVCHFRKKSFYFHFPTFLYSLGFTASVPMFMLHPVNMICIFFSIIILF